MPPLGRGVAAPFQGIAGHHDGAGDQAVAPLVIASDVHQEGTIGLREERLGGQGRCGSIALA
jgi:hypothetical protein